MNGDRVNYKGEKVKRLIGKKSGLISRVVQYPCHAGSITATPASA
jgi:hypothetical protein